MELCTILFRIFQRVSLPSGTGGELYDRIVESAEQHYGEEQAMKVVRQILEATQYFRI